MSRGGAKSPRPAVISVREVLRANTGRVAVYGPVSTHCAPGAGGAYGTLCGISVDDDAFVMVDTDEKTRISCPSCYSAYRVAALYTEALFTEAVRRHHV
jgi:hypothetical protein